MSEKVSPETFLSTESVVYSQTEEQVNELQNQILTQGKEIELYIKSHSQIHQSSSFKVLSILFDLFKTELSLNLSLRRSLIIEKQSAANSKSKFEEQYFQIEQFYSLFEQISGEKVHDLTTILQIFQNLFLKSQSSKNLQIIQKENIQLKEENKNLNDTISYLEKKLHKRQIETTIELAKVHSQADLNSTQNLDLQKNLHELEEKNNELQAKIEQITQNSTETKKELAEKSALLSKFTNKSNLIKDNIIHLENEKEKTEELYKNV